MDEDTNDGLFPDLLAEMGQGDLGTTIRQGQEGELETTSESAQGKDAGLERGNPEETSQPEPKVQTENEGREGKPVGRGSHLRRLKKTRTVRPLGLQRPRLHVPMKAKRERRTVQGLIWRRLARRQGPVQRRRRVA